MVAVLPLASEKLQLKIKKNVFDSTPKVPSTEICGEAGSRGWVDKWYDSVSKRWFDSFKKCGMKMFEKCWTAVVEKGGTIVAKVQGGQSVRVRWHISGKGKGGATALVL